jgi:hypothetical protein
MENGALKEPAINKQAVLKIMLEQKKRTEK